jgi:hypothetical protein
VPDIDKEEKSGDQSHEFARVVGLEESAENEQEDHCQDSHQEYNHLLVNEITIDVICFLEEKEEKKVYRK